MKSLLKRVLVILGGLAIIGPAHAGNGPWVLSEGDFSTYGEVQYQQWQHIADENGDKKSIGNRSLLTRLHLIATYGVAPRIDFEMKIGLAASSTSDPNLGACAELSCKPLVGSVPIEARVKWQILDEWREAPFSLALGATTRIGSFGATNRHRLTSFSEGTLDVGGVLSVGLSGKLGAVLNSFWLDFQYRYRIPNGIPEGMNPDTGVLFSVPGPELVLQGDWMVQPTSYFAFGPAWDILYRTKGSSLSMMDPSNRDAVASLAARAVKLGLKFDIHTRDFNAISFSFFRVVYAENNPSDLFFVSLGFSRFHPKKLDDE